MTKTRKMIIAVLTVVFAVAAAIWIAAARETSEPPPVPSDWELVSEEGQIASACIGGTWQECGQIKWTYRAPSPKQALVDLEQLLEEAGWSTGPHRPSNGLSALRKDEEARIYAHVEGSFVILTYVER